MGEKVSVASVLLGGFEGLWQTQVVKTAPVASQNVAEDVWALALEKKQKRGK